MNPRRRQWLYGLHTQQNGVRWFSIWGGTFDVTVPGIRYADYRSSRAPRAGDNFTSAAKISRICSSDEVLKLRDTR